MISPLLFAAETTKKKLYSILLEISISIFFSDPSSGVPPPYSLPSMSTTTDDSTLSATSDNVANLLRDLDPLVKLMENALKKEKSERKTSQENELSLIHI